MGDEPIEIDEGARGGFSRRNALKAGVAAGVGVAAWSGASITSLGGTPAFGLAGCTGAVQLDLSGGCTNTDQANTCPDAAGGRVKWRWHTLKSTGFPTGYVLTKNIAEGTCCSDPVPANIVATLTFPPGQTCTAFVQFYTPGGGGGECSVAGGTLPLGTSDTGTLNMIFLCPAVGAVSSTKYTILADCATTGSEGCFPTPGG